MLTTTEKISVEHFLQMEFEGEDAYYELINGEIVRKAAPTPRHQFTSGRIFAKMHTYCISNQLGEVFSAPIDVFLDEYNHLQPDILFIAKENLGIVDYRDGIMGAPQLVVEIISPGSYVVDHFDKKKAYELNGVREYWLVDPNNFSVEIYAHSGERFELAQAASESGMVQSIVLQEFALDVKDIFIQD